MERFPIVLTAILMIAIFTIIPVSKTLAAKDPFLDAGFIQARKQIPALKFTLEDLDGKQVQFTDFRGKVVLLFFWTTWWSWCRKEFPSLINIYNKFKDEDFVILGIDIEEKKALVKKYVDKTGIAFPILLDAEGQVARDYGIRGTPAHFLINRKGDIKAYAPGYKDWKNKKSRNLIEFMINETD